YAMFEKGVRQNLLGMGSAITIVFLIFVLILTLVQVYFVNRKVHY
ncbi:MAG: sugar ABC transporter permease, partial [Paracoccaceae bacterium]|nr:sugar ABC transporter permease [Paracoccaceae bacterium]